MNLCDSNDDTESLLAAYRSGQAEAESILLNRYRERLKRAISLRLDRRVAVRVDPSDIVQETLSFAAARLCSYANNQSIPFYPWLRQIALEQVLQHHRKHIHARKRSVRCEEPDIQVISDVTAVLWSGWMKLDNKHASFQGSDELREFIQALLQEMKADDREILTMRCLEELSVVETAEILGVSCEAVRSRLRRALERFGVALSKRCEG